MKLNLGAGDLREDGYVSVDLRWDTADIVADASCLPYEDESVEVVRAMDLLEHFPASRTAAVLAEWHRVLVPGGSLTLKVPNLYQLARAVMGCEEGDHPALAGYIRNIYGGHRFGPDGAWDAHHTGWTPKSLHKTLTDAGFHVITNDQDMNMTCEAKKR